MNHLPNAILTAFFLWPPFWYGDGGSTHCARTALSLKQNPEENKDAIAIGAYDFIDLIQRSNVFIDNSLLIREIVDMDADLKTVLWQGPDNWGKSMNMGMLKMFFEMRFDQKGQVIPKESTVNYKFFVNGEVTVGDGTIKKLSSPPLVANEKNENGSAYVEYLGRNPVIHISFEKITGVKTKYIIRSIRFAIRQAFKPYEFLANKLDDTDEFFKHFEVEDVKNVGYSLRYMCEKLSAHVNESESVLILIEDYDTPILRFLQSDRFVSEDVMEIFKILHQLSHKSSPVCYKGENDCMYRTIVTSKFKLENHTYGREFFLTDWNEPTDKYFGFNQKNVELLFEKYQVMGKPAEQALAWYGVGGAESPVSKEPFYDSFSIAAFLRSFRNNDFTTPKSHRDEYFFTAMFIVWSWFYRMELIFFKVVTKEQVEVENGAQLSVQDVVELAELCRSVSHRRPIENHLRRSRFEKIFVIFLLGEGYLTKIPNTNKAMLLNRDMASLMAAYAMKYYAKYSVRRAEVVTTVRLLLDFIEGDVNTTALEKSVQVMHNFLPWCGTPGINFFPAHVRSFFGASNNGVYNRPYCIGQYYLLRQCTSLLLCKSNFKYDAYYQKIPEADLVLIDKQKEQAMMLKIFDHTEEEIRPEVPNHKNIRTLFPNVHTIKLIGINILQNKPPQVLIQVINL